MHKLLMSTAVLVAAFAYSGFNVSPVFSYSGGSGMHGSSTRLKTSTN